MVTVIAALGMLWQGQAELPEDFIVVAHRGVVTETITENSIESLEAAIGRGYTHMEVDIRCTKDGHAVCLHDSNLERTTGVDKKITDITLDELHELVPENTAPSFEMFCDRAEGRIKLMPDVKRCPRDLEAAFAKSINDSLHKHDLMKSAIFIGQRSVINRMDLQGRTSISPAQNPDRAAESDPEAPKRHFVFGHAADFDEDNIAKYQKAGYEVIVSINTFHYDEGEYLSRGIDDVKKMKALGVDGLQIDSVYDEPLFGPRQ